jgi:flagellar hook-associated protein 3 FlgL
MRVTANTYSNLIVSSSQSSQQQLATLQQEISTGNSIQNASDDPTVYSQAAQDQNTLSQIGQFTQAAATATTMTAQNNQAMTSLHQIVAQAGEYLASVTTGMSSGDLQTLGTEMQGLVTQLTSIVNQKSSDGRSRARSPTTRARMATRPPSMSRPATRCRSPSPQAAPGRPQWTDFFTIHPRAPTSSPR